MDGEQITFCVMSNSSFKHGRKVLAELSGS